MALHFRVPLVFDNLLHKGEMPVTIGIFINPGRLVAPPADDAKKSSNRSFEYDTLSDQYARFLLEEILPEVGKKYKLTEDPECRAICGISSGGICAFTVAWQRPDAFRKVLSHVGSFTNIRGGHVYSYRGFNSFRTVPSRPYNHGICFHGSRATMVLDCSGFEIWDERDPAKSTEREDNPRHWGDGKPGNEVDGPWQRLSGAAGVTSRIALPGSWGREATCLRWTSALTS